MSMRVRLPALLMIEILGGDIGLRIVTCGQPRLSQMCLVHVIGRTGPSHLGRYPARLQSIGKHIGPATRDGKSEQRIVQLAFGVSLRTIPATLLPENVVEVCVGMVVHAGAKIDKPFRTLYERRQKIG